MHLAQSNWLVGDSVNEFRNFRMAEDWEIFEVQRKATTSIETFNLKVFQHDETFFQIHSNSISRAGWSDSFANWPSESIEAALLIKHTHTLHSKLEQECHLRRHSSQVHRHQLERRADKIANHSLSTSQIRAQKAQMPLRFTLFSCVYHSTHFSIVCLVCERENEKARD